MAVRRSGRRLAASWVGAGILLAGCQGGGTPAPPAPTVRKAPPPAAAPAKAPSPAYAYDPRGRRDPFRPLVVARAVTPRPKTGLASLDPNDLKLAGIVWDRRGYYALVEAPTGLGYVIRVNDVIGEEARVTKITPDGLTLEVEVRAELPRGKSQKRAVEIRLHKEEER